ncbi:MAG: VanZ family protein [Candidatus Omnitrophica bacterium]|nr:VanZ family protein [Candidatus Omnitrophota bacterium]
MRSIDRHQSQTDYRKIIRFSFPVVFYSGIIFYASSISTLTSPIKGPFSDKYMHVLEFFPFGFFLFHALWHIRPKRLFASELMVVLLGSFLYGLSDEIHQLFVVGRDANVLDVIADTLGGYLGGFVYAKVVIKYKRYN